MGLPAQLCGRPHQAGASLASLVKAQLQFRLVTLPELN